MVRAMVLTPLTTQQSGIPPASSILASLGCKVLQVVRLALVCFQPQHIAGSSILTIHIFVRPGRLPATSAGSTALGGREFRCSLSASLFFCNERCGPRAYRVWGGIPIVLLEGYVPVGRAKRGRSLRAVYRSVGW